MLEGSSNHLPSAAFPWQQNISMGSFTRRTHEGNLKYLGNVPSGMPGSVFFYIVKKVRIFELTAPVIAEYTLLETKKDQFPNSFCSYIIGWFLYCSVHQPDSQDRAEQQGHVFQPSIMFGLRKYVVINDIHNLEEVIWTLYDRWISCLITDDFIITLWYITTGTSPHK